MSRSRKFGWHNEGCRGRHERWLYSCERTGLSVFIVTEFVDGERFKELEVRHYGQDGKAEVVFRCDPEVGYLAFNYAKRGA